MKSLDAFFHRMSQRDFMEKCQYHSSNKISQVASVGNSLISFTDGIFLGEFSNCFMEADEFIYTFFLGLFMCITSTLNVYLGSTFTLCISLTQIHTDLHCHSHLKHLQYNITIYGTRLKIFSVCQQRW